MIKINENDDEKYQIILSTAYYKMKSKFNTEIYETWIDHFLNHCKNAKLVVYTNKESESVLDKYMDNKNIIKVIKPMKEFYGYKYRKEWKENHKENYLLNTITDWQLNMLWNEKVHFVYETYEKKYHVTANTNNENILYGWCDIGYFRCRNTEESGDIQPNEIKNWPNKTKTKTIINPKKIYYARVNNDPAYIKELFTMANNKSAAGIPLFEIPPEQNSIAGGFFLIGPENIEWWKNTYDNTLKSYFFFKRLIKDDQIILVDAIFSNMLKFVLIQEQDPWTDKWFQFQRYLL